MLIIKTDNLIISQNQLGPFIDHHDDYYLRLLNNINTAKPKFDNTKIHDIFYAKTKITKSLIRETQILDPVHHKVKMWKRQNNKPHSITLDIRGNKGLFAY